MKDNSIYNMNEREVQKYVHEALSDPSIVRATINGKRLQILSPGQINPFEGPDFKDIAILLEGSVILGDAEFHFKSSDWELHKHSNDERYRNVILHIVIQNDKMPLGSAFDTLIIASDEIEKMLNTEKKIEETDTASLEFIQHYALIRLLRKSAEIQEKINKSGFNEALHHSINEYLNKYSQRRKRPGYSAQKLDEIVQNIGNSPLNDFLNLLNNSEVKDLHDRLFNLMKTRIYNEGPHLRREIILNCVLPLAICIASEEARISLFLWYWSTPALNKYGMLTRKFKNIPQNFLWEQQGMLEFIKEHGRKTNVIREALSSYGFAEVLSFYRLGNPPFREDFE